MKPVATNATEDARFAPSVAAWLRREGASEDVSAWASTFGTDLRALWASCPRSDWMLAIAARLGVAPERLREAARTVVLLALDVLPDGDPAVQLLQERSADETALADQLEARSGEPMDPAVAAALLAIACVLRVEAAPESAAMAAALTSQALVLDAGDCAMLSVLGWSQRTSADRVRAILSADELLAR